MNVRKKSDLMLMLSVGMVAAIFAWDLMTPLGWADGFLYLIPLILILFRSPQRRYLIGFAALCSGLIVLGWLFSPPGGAVEPVTYNRTMGIALLWVTALFLRHRKQVEEALCLSQEGLERRVAERTDEFRLAIEKLKQEIADRKRVEEALRDSEQRLNRLREDRERISRNLHDNIIQMLYAIGLGLEECQRLFGEKSETAGMAMRRIVDDLNGVIRDVRSYVTWTEPKISSGRQLTAAIERLARTMEGAHLLHFRLNVSPAATERLIAEAAEHLLYIVREAMSNSLRHSRALNGLVSLQACDGRVRLTVEDDGVGFDTSTARAHGEGLRNIAARVEKLGGTFEIVSERGQGVRILIDLPGESEHAVA